MSKHTLQSVRLDARAIIHPACEVIETTHAGVRVFAIQHPDASKNVFRLDSGHSVYHFSLSCDVLARTIRGVVLW